MTIPKKRKSSGRARPARSALLAPEAAPAATETAAAPTCIQLEAGLEIKDAERVHRQLLGALAQGGAVAVDVGRVQIVDTAGVQLLVAFQCEAARRGMTIEFRGESAPLTHTLAVLGLREKLMFAVPHG